MSFWDSCMEPRPLRKPDTAYPSMDGDDVVCSNCGYIIGWDFKEKVCPSCGAKIDWSGNETDRTSYKRC